MNTSQLTAPDIAVFDHFDPLMSAVTIAAFLNTAGGRLLLGVDSDGRVQGIKDISDFDYFFYTIKKQISPDPRFSITKRKVGDKTIAVVDIPFGSERPYVVNDQIFIWREGRPVQAAPMQISEMILKRGSEATRWERQYASGIDIEDLDERQLSHTHSSYLERGSNIHRHENDVISFLKDLGVASDGQLLNSAAILFARSDQALPQSKIKIAAFHSLDRTNFIENKLLSGNLFDLFEQVTSFLDRHIPSSSSFEHHIRHDIMAIPPFVIRESIMNALVHRDYSQVNANIMIALHPDRLEVWNPGALPEGLSADSLPKTHVSRPTNPDIANAAFLRGLVEQWGSGTGRIVSECRRMGLRKPEWLAIGGGIQLTIHLTQDDTDSVQELNERMRVFVLKTYPGQQISIEEYQENWAAHVSERTARRDLDELVNTGFLTVRGGRPTIYIRTDKSEM